MNPDKLKKYRINQKLTQNQLAVKLGIDQSQISRWESAGQPIPKWVEILIKCWEDAEK